MWDLSRCLCVMPDCDLRLAAGIAGAKMYKLYPAKDVICWKADAMHHKHPQATMAGL